MSKKVLILGAVVVLGLVVWLAQGRVKIAANLNKGAAQTAPAPLYGWATGCWQTNSSGQQTLTYAGSSQHSCQNEISYELRGDYGYKYGIIGTQSNLSDTIAPLVPQNLSATATSFSVNLSWDASTDNVGVTGYKVYRNGTQVATLETNSYLDTGLVANTTYAYTIAAHDAASNTSAQSAAVSATTKSTTTVSNPTLTILVTQATPGQTVSVNVSNGPSNLTDWVGVAAVGSPDNTFLSKQWQYLNGTKTAPIIGVSSASLTFVLPTTLGSYEFRLYANDGFSLLARSTAVVVANATTLVGGESTALPSKIEFTTVDSNATGYGTFQSYNQKVVQNQYGIFMTNLRSRNDAYDQNTWRLSRSTDGGKTFITIYESTHGTSAPVIETDSSGVIYLAHPDWGVGYTKTDGLLYRFLPSNNFTNPAITTIPNSAAGKYSMMLDEKRGQLYFFSHNGQFNIVGLDGAVRRNYLLMAPGSSAVLQYPLMYMNSGDLYAAWTTSLVSKYMYWDIHFMISKDGGQTWQKPNGTRFTLPVIADETGPTDRITLDDEFDVFTWLETFLVKNGKVHFVYQAQTTPPREHYVRYDLATAKIDKNIYPDWGGKTIKNNYLDGFCASRADMPEIYCTSRAGDDKIATVYSSDNGETWHDYAKSDSVNNGAYSIGGARNITSDGYIVGSYTESGLNPPVVQFFKIKTGATPMVQTPTLTPSTIQSSPGQTISVSVANGPANPTDWVGIYATGATDTAFLQWKYLNDTKVSLSVGLASSTVTFAVPSTPGTYEFRFYASNGYVLLAKSATVTVVPAVTSTRMVDNLTSTLWEAIGSFVGGF